MNYRINIPYELFFTPAPITISEKIINNQKLTENMREIRAIVLQTLIGDRIIESFSDPMYFENRYNQKSISIHINFANCQYFDTAKLFIEIGEEFFTEDKKINEPNIENNAQFPCIKRRPNEATYVYMKKIIHYIPIPKIAGLYSLLKDGYLHYKNGEIIREKLKERLENIEISQSVKDKMIESFTSTYANQQSADNNFIYVLNDFFMVNDLIVESYIMENDKVYLSRPKIKDKEDCIIVKLEVVKNSYNQDFNI
ncbi:MAG: hypothetical protein KKC80_08700 [Candidatus Margulisbacteria bacterium]|nr:hypothetical protein [Candidatus Margulisiibacteriota bacterium]